MRTISIFVLLVYWSIIISAPIMSKDIKLNKMKFNKTEYKYKY